MNGLSLELFQRGIDQLDELLGRVRPQQATLATPCTDWDLQQLANHVVFDLQTFTAAVRETERPSPGADLIGDDWQAVYRAAAGDLSAAWQARGTQGTFTTQLGELPLTWALGQQLTDLAVHGWDVARSIEYPTNQLDADVGQAALDWIRENLKPQFRGRAFGPEVAVPDTAPVYDQLAGFSGRTP